jgi:hypothetical protein
MRKPNSIKIANRAVIAGLIIVIISFIIPIVPCTSSPVIAEPVYKLTTCKIPNPFAEQTLGISTKYYGVNTQPLAGLILQFIIATLIFLIIFNILSKKSKSARKILDLTENTKK